MSKDKVNQDSLSENADEQFLQRIFSNSDINEEDDFPLAEVPANLSEKLYAIPKQGAALKPKFNRWAKLGSIAASICLALVLLGQGIEHQQQKAEALQAKQDLEIALFYLNKANQKASHNVNKTLKVNLQKATVVPVIETVYGVTSS